MVDQTQTQPDPQWEQRCENCFHNSFDWRCTWGLPADDVSDAPHCRDVTMCPEQTQPDPRELIERVRTIMDADHYWVQNDDIAALTPDLANALETALNEILVTQRALVRAVIDQHTNAKPTKGIVSAAIDKYIAKARADFEREKGAIDDNT